jgi:(1->4)-alpha-D-glucan 1-alpha-D-glucosylmutase
MPAVRATYRVQVRPAFDLDATAGLVDYLADLGVSHLYTAPLLTAAPGSEHGYDVVDHTRVGDAIGGEAARRRLAGALRAAGLGLVVDIVPNHVGVAVPAANPAWWDLLKHGRRSRYAAWFDVDWTRGRLLIPVLSDEPDALDELKVVGDELHYFQHRYPIAPGTLGADARSTHDRQHYELASWRRGDTELTYRRFFAVTDLAGVRVEDPAVFEATHREVLRWVADGDADGIRVDHPDGLRDPDGYLRRLAAAAPDAWLIVEKILEVGEQLPDWPVAGTTGYDALREVCGLFVDPAGLPPAADWPGEAYRGKREAATRLLAAELGRLARAAGDDTAEVRAALAEIAAGLPVYRTYLPAGAQHLRQACDLAIQRRPELADTVRRLHPLLSEPDTELGARFPQFSGAVMAKGVEDTAFYRYSRFTALNEVGGDPGESGVGLAEFHELMAARTGTGMTTLSTHDTKRSEDVRARLAVLSELPDEWAAAQHRWVDRVAMPDPAFAALLWQAAVGAWPIEPDRLHAYALKAAREASTHTGYADPDTGFEATVHAAVETLYTDPDLADLVATIEPDGWSNALGQKLVQLTMPGVPDVYQGTELWDFSLVDPDNRRPVDFAARRALLARLDGKVADRPPPADTGAAADRSPPDGAGAADGLPPVDATGAAKLLVTSRALRLRRDRPELFTGYTPIAVRGPAAAHAVAFDRGGAISVATRLPVGLRRAGGWAATTLVMPAGRWTDVLTGRLFVDQALPLAALLDRYPVELLIAGADHERA